MVPEMGQSANIVEAEEEQQQNLIGVGAAAEDQVIPPGVAQADRRKTPTRRAGGFRGGRGGFRRRRYRYTRLSRRGCRAYAGPLVHAIPSGRAFLN